MFPFCHSFCFAANVECTPINKHLFNLLDFLKDLHEVV